MNTVFNLARIEPTITFPPRSEKALRPGIFDWKTNCKSQLTVQEMYGRLNVCFPL